MRCRRPLVLVIALFSCALPGQARPLRLDIERLRLGADTIDLSVVQGPQRGASGPLTSVHTLARGTRLFRSHRTRAAHERTAGRYSLFSVFSRPNEIT